ncbi:hypothetical protein LEP1GSC074_3137 [Leptospira noguchii str. Hook]|nr:hypothetical protein LEP1GSC074_3137 [Leptospira noguchii str. Hook]
MNKNKCYKYIRFVEKFRSKTASIYRFQKTETQSESTK